MPIYRVPVEIINPLMPSSGFNIWHLRTTDSTTDPGEGISALHTWYSSLTGYMANQTTIRFPDSVVEVTTQEDKPLGSVPPDVVESTTSGNPVGMAYVISWKTSIRARRGRGRTFFGPLYGAWDTDGNPATTFKGALTTACDALLAESQGNLNGWAFGVYGRENANVPEPRVLRDFTGYSLSAKFSHLRSRRD